MKTNNTVIEAQQLTKNYVLGKNNELPVLKAVDLKIERGEFVAVMGASGSGKSTLLYNVCGMDRMTSGSVLFNGVDLSLLPEPALARIRLTNMGFIFQQIHLLKNLSIFDNIVLSGYLCGNRTRREVERRATELMEQTGITEIASNDITQASGGQLQRVGICRALINKPDIIFGDEPTGALNSKASGEIMDLLGGVHREGTTVMLVTHDVKVASRTERVLFMMDGRIVAEKRMGVWPANGNGGAGDRETEVAAHKAREAELAQWLIELGF
ncbi:MAG: ABC transporter ATP-binding protein [Spirochaetaceae bacterium]|nr:MAG: ABC transporter ATP-binding protein [Spirochaetaceae bacterium]